MYAPARELHFLQTSNLKGFVGSRPPPIALVKRSLSRGRPLGRPGKRLRAGLKTGPYIIRVHILFKRGTQIHSDLAGVSRIEFNESVEEKVLDIEQELRAAGLIE